MRVILFGACGRMGKELERLLSEEGSLHQVVAKVDACGGCGVYASLSQVREEADVIVDFSHHSATYALVDGARAKKLPLVIATTGHNEAELAAIRSGAEHIPVFHSANMSMGVALQLRMAKEAARIFPHADIEIVEKHHNRKLDAPSGTALLLAQGIKEVREEATFVYGRAGQHKRDPREIGIHALRMGSVIGEHDVILSTDSETFTISHVAHSRSLFAEGAISAAAFLCLQEAGLYTMKDMVGGDR